jgi:hypothetical protein
MDERSVGAGLAPPFFAPWLSMDPGAGRLSMALGGNVSHVFAQCYFEVFRAYASGLSSICKNADRLLTPGVLSH